jgi:hypothetical protein
MGRHGHTQITWAKLLAGGDGAAIREEQIVE